jgi:hypothetical protein
MIFKQNYVIKFKFIARSVKFSVDQLLVLKPLNLFPYYHRIFYRLSLFPQKIMNTEILTNIRETLVNKSYRDSDNNLCTIR